MKTVKKILLSVFVFVMIGACNPPEEVIPENFVPQQKNLHFEAELFAPPFSVQDGLNLETTENATCNLAQEVVVALSSAARYRQGFEQIELFDGEIDMTIPQSGGYLVGDFEGKVFQSSTRLIINADIFVYHGTGALSADGGKLTLSIDGSPAHDLLMKYTIKIDGYLENRVANAN